MAFVELAYNRAVMLAQKSCMIHRHGCVILNPQGQVVAEAYNRPFDGEHIFSLHAEASALAILKKRGQRYASKCTLYVVRVCKQNTTQMSKPCPMCTDAINKSGIKRVFYTVNSTT